MDMAETTPHLRLSDVQGWYGESHVLHGVDLSIMPGEILMLTGRNGAGKTTTLKAIAALLKKRTGKIEIAGKDVTGTPRHRLAYEGLAYVPEERGIFSSLTVEENLHLPVVVAEGGMTTEEIYTLFPNLKERRTSPGTKLSGGEQQMLAMARVLRTGARLLMLDEPTEGLAPETAEDDDPSGRTKFQLFPWLGRSAVRDGARPDRARSRRLRN